MTSRFGRAAFAVGVLAVLGWLVFEWRSTVAKGRQPQLTRSVSAALSPESEIKVTLPPQWADRMVLQRDIPIPISGTAEPGKEVTIIFGEQVKTATADAAGNWRSVLDPSPPSAEPRDLRVIPGCIKCSREIRNVLVGDVWLCGGSPAVPGGVNDRHDVSTIRFTRVGGPDLAESWEECTGAGARKLPARYRDFAEALQADLSVPIGLIDYVAPSGPDAPGPLPPARLAEVIPFPIRGVLWSIPPETPARTAAGLAENFQSWRAQSGQPDLPLLFFADGGDSGEIQRAIAALPGRRALVVRAENSRRDSAALSAAAQQITKFTPQ